MGVDIAFVSDSRSNHDDELVTWWGVPRNMMPIVAENTRESSGSVVLHESLSAYDYS